MNHLKCYYHVAKHSVFHFLGVNPCLTSVRCMLCLATVQKVRLGRTIEMSKNHASFMCDSCLYFAVAPRDTTRLH